jgi:hypothetical protein
MRPDQSATARRTNVTRTTESIAAPPETLPTKVRPAGTISNAKQTSESDCGSGAVVRHQPLIQSSRSLAVLLLSFATGDIVTRPVLHFSADRSAGIMGFEQMPVATKFVMLLGVGKHAHENQSCQNTSGYEILHHGCHSTGLAHCALADRAADDDHHRRGRQCALCRFAQDAALQQGETASCRRSGGPGPFCLRATYMRHTALVPRRLQAKRETAWPKTTSRT